MRITSPLPLLSPLFALGIALSPLDAQMDPAVRGSGTPNFVPRWTDTSQIGNSIIFQDTTLGRIGIGTSAPATKLDVVGNVTATAFNGAFVGNGSGLTNLVLPNILTGVNNTSIGQGALSSNTTGTFNTAAGVNALFSNTTGFKNTAVGHAALVNNTTGTYNTAVGFDALFSNTTGTYNTAVGVDALHNNTTGLQNTAVGHWALHNNTTGNYNTASGFDALVNNTTGGYNTAVGHWALIDNTSGAFNVAVGQSALIGNTTGAFNVAVGQSALRSNKTGAGNAAVGLSALSSNTTGGDNIAVGRAALLFNTSGSQNIAIGVAAGVNQTTGSGNIYVANRGVAEESDTIRIGSTHTRAFLAGVRGVTTGVADAVTVVVDSDGQLGTMSSSRRFKEDVRDMGATSSDLMRLRPVMFRYKRQHAGNERPLQPGLIAEEVAEVYPDLVTHSADGQVETVQYRKLTTMLLNELQKQQKQIERLATRLARLESPKGKRSAATAR